MYINLTEGVSIWIVSVHVGIFISIANSTHGMISMNSSISNNHLFDVIRFNAQSIKTNHGSTIIRAMFEC